MNPRTIGVAGLGHLGRGIAACLLAHGFQVIGYTRRAATHRSARDYIAAAIDDLIREAGFPNELASEWSRCYAPVDTLASMANCDFVIESVVEDLSVKQRIFDELELIVRPDIPIASNTSALPITLLQQERKHPARFLGMHWAEPSHATRFMELIRGQQTCDTAFQTAADLAVAIGKEPSLVQKDVPGFVVNRIGYAMYREALHLLETGVADIETIDRSCRNALGCWATLCGPLRWIDISGGPALYARAMASVLPTLCNTKEVSPNLKKLADEGAEGLTNGHGFYDYDPEETARWSERFRQHAWQVRRLLDENHPR